MTPEKMFSDINRDLSNPNERENGAVIHVALDREPSLCARVGYTGLFRIVRQLRKRLIESGPEGMNVVRLGLSSLIARAPLDDAEVAEDLAQTLFDSLKAHTFQAGAGRVAVTVSMGACRTDRRFANADELLLALSRRVETIAGEGGNAWAVVEPKISVRQALGSDDHMLGLLTEALRSNGLKVVFQPLLATDGNESRRAYQMLPRLEASEGRLIAAAEFIPVARDAALLPVIDRWMVAHARRLLSGPFRNEDIGLFVNQSDALLTDTARQAWLGELLEKAPELQNRIIVELSMDDAMNHMDGTLELLRMMREGHAETCLSRVDDRSRWDLLENDLKCDYLRMSPGFGKKLARDRKLASWFMELSAPVREAGTRIIMPMVEDSETAATLWRCGADYMQGNMIQAPENSIAV